MTVRVIGRVIIRGIIGVTGSRARCLEERLGREEGVDNGRMVPLHEVEAGLFENFVRPNTVVGEGVT
jgi:hypothetical protein